MAMKPYIGAVGGYFSETCNLEVEVVHYEETEEKETFWLKVLKKPDSDSHCRYEKDSEFEFVRVKDIENRLEDIIIH